MTVAHETRIGTLYLEAFEVGLTWLGFAPPEAENVCEYGVPTVPLNRGGTVVMVKGAGLIVRA